MNITKYGISAAMIAAIGYFAGYMGIIPGVLILGFTVFSDIDVDAKKNVTQAVVLAAFFTFLGVIFSALDNGYVDLLNSIKESLLKDAGSSKYETVTNVMNWFYKLNAFAGLIKITNLAEFGFMIYGVISSLKGNVVKLPVISKIVAKHYGENV